VLILASLAGCLADETAYGGDGAQPPRIAWTDNEVDDIWTVSQASHGNPWSDLNLKGSRSVAGYRYGTSGPMKVVGRSETYEPVAGASEDVAAGQVLAFCGTETATTFTLLHTPSNTIIHQFTFATLMAC